MSTIYRVAISAVLTLLLGLPQAPLLAGPGGARLEGAHRRSFAVGKCAAVTPKYVRKKLGFH